MLIYLLVIYMYILDDYLIPLSERTAAVIVHLTLVISLVIHTVEIID